MVVQSNSPSPSRSIPIYRERSLIMWLWQSSHNCCGTVRLVYSYQQRANVQTSALPLTIHVLFILRNNSRLMTKKAFATIIVLSAPLFLVQDQSIAETILPPLQQYPDSHIYVYLESMIMTPIIESVVSPNTTTILLLSLAHHTMSFNHNRPG